MSEKLRMVKKVEWKYDEECQRHTLEYSLIANVLGFFGVLVYLTLDSLKDVFVWVFILQVVFLASVVLFMIIGISREVYYEEV